jgi:uncharacterized protein (DUF2062 family)
MLFRQRERRKHWDRFRLWLWPRVSWRRSGLYFLKRILRLSGTPHAVALGTAIGMAVSFTPLLGFHLLITFAIAWMLGGNMIAGALGGTVFANPLTLPFVWAGTYQLGHRLLEGRAVEAPARIEHDLAHKSIDQILPLIKPMLVGSIPIGIASGILTYLLVYKGVAAYQAARRKRFADRRDDVISGPAVAGMGRKP